MDRGAVELSIDVRCLKGERVLVALSGGADSVALLLLLLEAGADVCAAHFEHGIRGEDSEGDLAFCRELCATRGVQFLFERGDAPAQRLEGEGLETCARRLRHAFLRRAAAAAGAGRIALAHHADDQAETVLMHLARGSGVHGAAGMRAYEPPLWRPLLNVRKAALIAFLRARAQPWREDATNRLQNTPRNALRLEVLPRLQRVYPGAVDALCRFARLQGEEDAFVSLAARRWTTENTACFAGLCRFALEAMPPDAILRRALCAQLGQQADFARVEELLRLAHSARGRLTLADGTVAEKTESSLYFLDPDWRAPEAAPFSPEGASALEGIAGICARGAQPEPVRTQRLRQILSRAALEGAQVRTRRAGDWIQPLGMRGRKLLSDYLTDRKVPQPLRDRLALIARGGEVLWVAGVGISERCAVGEGVSCVEVACKYVPGLGEEIMGGGTQK